jgi:polyisoprenyl-phosphate glycosyltransferase
MDIHDNSNLVVDIIIPLYNEAEIIHKFHDQLINSVKTLPYQFKFYYINDGSTDETSEILRSIAIDDNRIIIIELSRNFGHQSAISAGLDQAKGDCVITMDGDGQHPSTLIPQMINLYLNGYDIVQTQRKDGNTGKFKKYTSKLFYRLIGLISNTAIHPGTADFRLMSRRSVDALKMMPEYHKFLRGLVPWIGFTCVIIPYFPLERIGGSSKYSIRKMLILASDAIFSFSTTPIKISLVTGVIFLIIAFCEIIYSLIFWLSNQYDKLQPGWTSLMFVSLLGNAVILINIGIIGIYVGYVFQQVKGRPNYIVKSIIKKEKD